MKKDDTTEAALGCVVLLLSWPLIAIWNGYALSVLWSWFVVPTFEVRPLSVPAAIGIAAVVGYLTHQVDDYTDKEKTRSQRFLEAIIIGLARPAFALAFGWVVYQFM